MLTEITKNKTLRIFYLLAVIVVLLGLANIINHTSHCDKDIDNCNICLFSLLLFTAIFIIIAYYTTSIYFSFYIIKVNLFDSICNTFIIRGPPQPNS